MNLGHSLQITLLCGLGVEAFFHFFLLQSFVHKPQPRGTKLNDELYGHMGYPVYLIKLKLTLSTRFFFVKLTFFLGGGSGCNLADSRAKNIDPYLLAEAIGSNSSEKQLFLVKMIVFLIALLMLCFVMVGAWPLLSVRLRWRHFL